MTGIEQLLRAAIEQDASDIHLKADQVPVFRVHGTLTNAPFEPLCAEDMQAIADNMLPPRAAASFNKNHEADFSFQVEGIGRFRVNCFLTRGVPAMALRHVKTQIPDFEELRLHRLEADIDPDNTGSLALLKKHGGGIFTSIRAGRKEAIGPSPKTLDWIYFEAMLRSILWFLNVVKLRSCGCLVDGSQGECLQMSGTT